MAVTDAYLTATQFRGRYKLVDIQHDTVLDNCLLACTRVFERETGQFFGLDASVVNRVYYGTGAHKLELYYDGAPGIGTTTGLEVKEDTDGDGSFADESAWTLNTDFQLLPLNADKGAEAKPWDTLFVPSWSSKGIFSKARRYQVTARFGWPAVPEAVKQDVAELCSIWLGINPRASGRINELDEVVTVSPMAMSLIRRFRDAYPSKVTF